MFNYRIQTVYLNEIAKSNIIDNYNYGCHFNLYVSKLIINIVVFDLCIILEVEFLNIGPFDTV